MARGGGHAPLSTSVFASARFVCSVAEPDGLHAVKLAMVPELAFAGRSNAGKSSAINVLTAQRQLAFASKTPGRTQLINFFELSRRIEGDEQLCAYLVDLPGYGFAKVDETTRARWDALIGDYLVQRRMLAGLVLVVDARRGLMAADEALLGWLGQRERPEALRLHVLLTKADQLGKAARAQVLAQTHAHAHALPFATSVQLFSALKREGVDELQDNLLQIIES